MAPTYTYKLSQNPETCNYDTRSLNCVIVGGGPPGEEQILKMRKLLPHTVVCNMYGMTELAGLATMFSLQTERDLIDSKPLSTGRPVPGLSYKVNTRSNNNLEYLSFNNESSCFMNVKHKILICYV